MSWEKEAENDLRNDERRLQSLQNMAEKIRTLREQMLSIRGGMSDSAPVQGGSSSAQDRMIDCIAEIERLGHTLSLIHISRAGRADCFAGLGQRWPDR